MSHPELEKCIEVIRRLHDPVSGCPWDLQQTHASLLPYLLEESYEFIEACGNQDEKAMEEELGDVLLQVLHHATLAEGRGTFSLESTSKLLSEKMIRRHPHVFGPKEETLSSEAVASNWQKIKALEKGSPKYVMQKKLLNAPALQASFDIGRKSTTVNFDWSDYYQVLSKVEEEWQEVKEELPPGGNFNRDRVKEEIGDLLFSVAQLARHLDLNPEECLREANQKFIRRFQRIEDLVRVTGRQLSDYSQDELETLWVRAKRETGKT